MVTRLVNEKARIHLKELAEIRTKDLEDLTSDDIKKLVIFLAKKDGILK